MLKVMIVDDAERMLERIREILLEKTDTKIVGEFGDSHGLLEKIREMEPDVVILDIYLTGKNGIQVLEEIQAEKKPPTVIMLTAYPYPQYRKKCFELGADYFLDKTVDFEQIPQVLGEIENLSQ